MIHFQYVEQILAGVGACDRAAAFLFEAEERPLEGFAARNSAERTLSAVDADVTTTPLGIRIQTRTRAGGFDGPSLSQLVADRDAVLLAIAVGPARHFAAGLRLASVGDILGVI